MAIQERLNGEDSLSSSFSEQSEQVKAAASKHESRLNVVSVNRLYDGDISNLSLTHTHTHTHY